MSYSFAALAGEYTSLLATMRVTRAQETNATASRLLRYVPRYRDVSASRGVQGLLLGTRNNRDSDAYRKHCLGNGEPLTRVTRLVPKGRGPFSSWEAGAKDALHIDKLDQVK